MSRVLRTADPSSSPFLSSPSCRQPKEESSFGASNQWTGGQSRPLGSQAQNATARSHHDATGSAPNQWCLPQSPRRRSGHRRRHWRSRGRHGEEKRRCGDYPPTPDETRRNDPDYCQGHYPHRRKAKTSRGKKESAARSQRCDGGEAPPGS